MISARIRVQGTVTLCVVSFGLVGACADGIKVKPLEHGAGANEVGSSNISAGAGSSTLGGSAAHSSLSGNGGADSSAKAGTTGTTESGPLMWEPRAPMPTPRCEFGTVVLDGLIYTIGGTVGSTVDVVEVYDPAANAWSKRAAMPTRRQRLVTAAVGGFIYAIGGFQESADRVTYTNVTEIYDPVKDAWRSDPILLPIPKMADGARGSQFIAGAALNGAVYVAVFGAPSLLFAYDPVMRGWSVLPDGAPTFRDAATAVPLDRGLFFLGAKSSSIGTGANLGTYDPVTRTWRALASLPSEEDVLQVDQSIGQVRGALYAVGGSRYQGPPRGELSARVMRWTPESKVWTDDSCLPSARHSVGLATVDDTLYAIGGSVEPALRIPTGEVAAGRVLSSAALRVSSDTCFSQPNGAGGSGNIDPHLGAAGTTNAPCFSSSGTTVGYPAGDNPSALVIGDINADGYDDLVVANRSPSGTVSVLLGIGNGAFAPKSDYPAGPNPASLAIGDLDDDGLEDDLAVAYGGLGGSIGVSVLIGRGGSRLEYTADHRLAMNTWDVPRYVGVGDLNGDGHLDLIVAAGQLYTLLGAGGGAFSQGPTRLDTRSAALSDLNHDGKLDVVCTSNSYLTEAGALNCHMDIALGQGDGSFIDSARYDDFCSTSITIGDLDGDGRSDLIETGSILLDRGDGTFAFQENNPSVTAVVIGDLNGDGFTDLATPNGSVVQVRLGQGKGSFGNPLNYSTANAPTAIAIGELDGDGMLDLALANPDDDQVTVLLNRCPSQ